MARYFISDDNDPGRISKLAEVPMVFLSLLQDLAELRSASNLSPEEHWAAVASELSDKVNERVAKGVASDLRVVCGLVEQDIKDSVKSLSGKPFLMKLDPYGELEADHRLSERWNGDNLSEIEDNGSTYSYKASEGGSTCVGGEASSPSNGNSHLSIKDDEDASSGASEVGAVVGADDCEVLTTTPMRRSSRINRGPRRYISSEPSEAESETQPQAKEIVRESSEGSSGLFGRNSEGNADDVGSEASPAPSNDLVSALRERQVKSSNHNLESRLPGSQGEDLSGSPQGSNAPKRTNDQLDAETATVSKEFERLNKKLKASVDQISRSVAKEHDYEKMSLECFAIGTALGELMELQKIRKEKDQL